MRRRLLLALPLLSPLAARADVPLGVVATFSVLADLVRRVGGEAVDVQSLVGPGGDAHVFQPRPADLRRLQDAALVVENGLGLEGWLTRMVRASGFHGARVVASAGIAPRSMQEGGRRVPDPHVWQDPRNAVRMVAAIADGLAAADPARAGQHRGRAEAFAAEIMRVDAEIERQVAEVPAPKRQVITSHDAFGYFGARYGITFHAAQGISTEAEPTPRALAQLAAQVRRDGVRAVFVESMTDPRIAQALARESGAVVGGTVYSDSLSPPGGPAATYLDMLRHNTALFVPAMLTN